MYVHKHTNTDIVRERASREKLCRSIALARIYAHNDEVPRDLTALFENLRYTLSCDTSFA